MWLLRYYSLAFHLWADSPLSAILPAFCTVLEWGWSGCLLCEEEGSPPSTHGLHHLFLVRGGGDPGMGTWPISSLHGSSYEIVLWGSWIRKEPDKISGLSRNFDPWIASIKALGGLVVLLAWSMDTITMLHWASPKIQFLCSQCVARNVPSVPWAYRWVALPGLSCKEIASMRWGIPTAGRRFSQFQFA